MAVAQFDLDRIGVDDEARSDVLAGAAIGLLAATVLLRKKISDC